MTSTLSTSQKIFLREDEALKKMPRMPGEAACTGDKRFDILAEKNRISKDVRNTLASICVRCPLRDCGWRQARIG